MTDRRSVEEESAEEPLEEEAPSPEEEPIDEAVWESFPASDVPSTSSPTQRIGAPASPTDDEDDVPDDDDRERES